MSHQEHKQKHEDQAPCPHVPEDEDREDGYRNLGCKKWPLQRQIADQKRNERLTKPGDGLKLRNHKIETDEGDADDKADDAEIQTRSTKATREAVRKRRSRGVVETARRRVRQDSRRHFGRCERQSAPVAAARAVTGPPSGRRRHATTRDESTGIRSP